MSTRLAAAACALLLLLTGCSSSGSADDAQPSSAPTVSIRSDPTTVPVPDPTTDPVVTRSPVKTKSAPRTKTPSRTETAAPSRTVKRTKAAPATPKGVPNVGVGAPFRCTSALEALEAAGADTLEPGSAPVNKALTQCHDVAEWVGGLYAVAGALGYSSASQLDDETITSDLQVVCSGGLRTPTCRDADKRGLLD